MNDESHAPSWPYLEVALYFPYPLKLSLKRILFDFLASQSSAKLPKMAQALPDGAHHASSHLSHPSPRIRIALLRGVEVVQILRYAPASRL